MLAHQPPHKTPLIRRLGHPTGLQRRGAAAHDCYSRDVGMATGILSPHAGLWSEEAPGWDVTNEMFYLRDLSQGVITRGRGCT
jgi:hypothetical protein